MQHAAVVARWRLWPLQFYIHVSGRWHTLLARFIPPYPCACDVGLPDASKVSTMPAQALLFGPFKSGTSRKVLNAAL
jgi:hypothetical protein